MCGPAIGIIGSLAGGVMSAMGSIYQGKMQAAQYKAQAKAAEFQAQAERDAGRFEAGRMQDKGLRLRGDQIVAYASEGLDLSGSVSDVISDTKTEVELDMAAIKTNSENRARVNDYEAKVAKMNASSAKTAGMIGAVGAIIGGVTSAAGSIPSGGIGSAFTSTGTTGAGLAPKVNSPAQLGGFMYYGGPR